MMPCLALIADVLLQLGMCAAELIIQCCILLVNLIDMTLHGFLTAFALFQLQQTDHISSSRM